MIFTIIRISSLIVVLLFFTITLNGQDQKWVVNSKYNTVDWAGFVNRIENENNLKFFYSIKDFENVKLPNINEEINLFSYLEKSLVIYGIKFTHYKNSLIFTKGFKIKTKISKTSYPKLSKKKEAKEIIAKKSERDNYLKTNKEHLGAEVIIGNLEDGLKSRRVKLTGSVVDEKDFSACIGASVMLQELGIGCVVNTEGNYSFNLKKGKYTLVVNDINHKEKKVPINVLSSGNYDFYLEKNSINLDGIIITADGSDRVKSIKMGMEKLNVQFIKDIPLVMGERDIIKVAQLLPGIQNVGEGASGFNVRGAPVDQNSFYLDGIPIYNTSHFFGFFSVFNSDAIKDFSISKSSIQAEHGGRLASVFDITAKEGNLNKFKFRGGISPVTGRIMLEGPIKKTKSSYMVSLRSTYSNWILKLIDRADFKNSKVFFADAIAKFSFDLNKKNKIYLLGYYSFDDIDFAHKSLYDIKNNGVSVNWKHFFNDKNNMKLSLVHSTYNLNSTDKEFLLNAYSKSNNLQHEEIKIKFKSVVNSKINFNYGGVGVLYNVDRGKLTPFSSESRIIEKNFGIEKGVEFASFFSINWKVNSNFKIRSGLRYNLFSPLGAKSVYIYENGVEKMASSIRDTLNFSDNQFVKKYTGLDYRISSNYSFNRNFSVKASYNRLHQYIFLLSNTIALSPTDSWKLAGYNIEPMKGDQLSLGIYSKLFNRRYEFSVEGYIKKINNLVEFKDGADLLVSEVPEWDILQGKLDVIGLELMLKKAKGRFSGWVNYTYSNASVLVDSDLKGNQINFGNPYSANHDKPHSFNLVTTYRINRRISLSSNIVYSTGKPITYPTTVYYLNGIKLVNFTGRNSYRLPDYFRMDVSVKAEGNLKLKKKLHGALLFSVYNLLGRHNIYNAYFKVKDDKVQGYKISIFANPIFSITYNFKFGNYEY